MQASLAKQSYQAQIKQRVIEHKQKVMEDLAKKQKAQEETQKIKKAELERRILVLF